MFFKNNKKLFCLVSFLFLSILFFPKSIFASSTDGTILNPDQYAWGNNVGWINFGTADGDVHVTSSELSGYAWDSIYGWINLNPTYSGVKNDGNGNLSGFAWSQGAGFIDFSGVSINSSGKFTGQAYGATYGIINFNCTHCNVSTDWRATTSAATSTPPIQPITGGGGGGGISGNPILIGTPIVPPETPTTPIPPTNTTPPEENNETPTNPSQVPENPVNSEPVVNQSGLPVVNTAPGKTFVSQPQTLAPINVSLFFNNVIKNLIPDIKKILNGSKKIINTPQGSVITKSISTLGIISAVAAPLTSITFSDLWLNIIRFFGLLFGAWGLKRKERPWGTVYDSITKRPLDPVYVSLINSETGKEVSGAITDIDGRYGFLVLPGKYRIEAKKTNYIEPSVKMKGKLFDEVYSDLYFGEDINVTEEGQIISKNIPMDSLSFDWNEFAKTKMNVNKFIRQRDITWAKISGIIFFIGAIVAAIALIAAPAPYNYIIAGLYVLAYILNYIVFKNKKSGTLTEKSTGAPLSFAIVKIFREGEDIPLTKKIADKFGAYYALVPSGKYYITVDKKNDDQSYSEIFHSGIAYIKNGVINENLKI
jgi:hypothetical protein